MFEIPASFNPLVIDIAILVIIAIACLIGIFKASSKVLVELLIKLVSFALAFTSIFNFLKKAILNVLNLNKLFEISNEILSYVVGLLHVFLASLIIYYILRLLLKIVVLIVKKLFFKKGKKTIFSRIMGGVVNAVYAAVVMSLLVYNFSADIYGLKETINQTPVSSKVVKLIDDILEKPKIKEITSTEKIAIMLIDGNILNDTSSEELKAYYKTYEEILMVISNPNGYYDPLKAGSGATAEQRHELLTKIVESMVTISNLSTMIKDRFQGIVPISDDLLAQFINPIPTGVTVSLPPDLELKLVTALTKLDGSESVRNNIYELVGYVP